MDIGVYVCLSASAIIGVCILNKFFNYIKIQKYSVQLKIQNTICNSNKLYYNNHNNKKTITTK